MKTLFAITILGLLTANVAAADQPSAPCIDTAQKSLIKVQALQTGSVKLFVNHSQLGLNTPVSEIHAATTRSMAELNADGPVVTLTWSWMPYNVAGFEVYATAAGVEKLQSLGYCYGKID